MGFTDLAKDYWTVLLCGSILSACSAESGSFGSLEALTDDRWPSKESGFLGNEKLDSDSVHFKLSEEEPGLDCPGGGVKIELWQDDPRTGQPTLLKQSLNCGESNDAKRWVLASPCSEGNDFNCLLTSSTPSAGYEGNTPGTPDTAPTAGPSLCSRNFETGCLANDDYPAGDLLLLSPQHVKAGVTIAGIQGEFSDRPVDCTSSVSQECVANASFPALDKSNLIPGNIRKGVNVAGIDGSYPSTDHPLEGSLGSDLPSLSATVPAGNYQFFKSDGTRVTGMISDPGTVLPGVSQQNFSSSLYRGFSVAGSNSLSSDKILAGVTIFGVTGNVSLPPIANVKSGTYFGAGSTEFEGAINACSTPNQVDCVSNVDYKAYPECTSDGSIDCAANATYQAWRVPTASITSSVSDADEGTSVDLTVSTTNISDGTDLLYEISGPGISGSDFVGGVVRGQFSINSGQGSVTLNLKEDNALEGPETLTMAVYHSLASQNVDINDTSTAHIPDPSLTTAWYDASDSNSLTVSSTFVTGWNDLGPNGYHLSQSNSDYRPKYQTSGWNGGSMPYIDWGTVDNNDALTRTGSIGVREIFIVAQYAHDNFANWPGLLNDSSNILFLGAGGAWYGGSFSSALYHNGSTAGTSTAFPTTSSPFVIHGRSSSSVSLSKLVVGMDREYHSLNRGWQGKIAEIIIYNQTLTPEFRARTEGYLAWKWGIESSLVSGHPHKLQRP